MPPEKRPAKKRPAKKKAPARKHAPRTQPPNKDKEGGKKLQKARLMGAASNVIEIFNDPEHPASKRDRIDYTDPYFNPLEQVYTEAAQSGLTWHEWAEQQRAQGREPIHEVIDKMAGEEAAAQYPAARELIENLRDLDRMGTGDVAFKPGKRKTPLGEFEDVPPRPKMQPRPEGWPRQPPSPRDDNPLTPDVTDDEDELYRHGWYRDQARDAGKPVVGEIKRRPGRRT